MSAVKPLKEDMLGKTRNAHPNAFVRQIKNNNLFLIEYTNLKLVVSYETIIGFCYENEWHLSVEKISRVTNKHRYHLMDLFTISRWYLQKKELLEKLRQILKIESF